MGPNGPGQFGQQFNTNGDTDVPPNLAAQPLVPLPPQMEQQPAPPTAAWAPQADPLSAGYAGAPGPLPTQPIIQNSPSGKGKLVAVVLVLSLLMLGGAAAAYQYLYVPNTPANIFKTGMQRSGEALGQLSTDATEASKLQALEQSEINGSMELKADDATYAGTIRMSNDPDSNETDLTASMTDQDGKKSQLGVQLLAEKAQDARLPDMYLKMQGLKALGLDALLPGISAYDNKWIGFSSTFLEQLIPEDAAALDTGNELTSGDVTEATKTVTSVVQKYILTDEPANAVLSQKRFVATEQLTSDITANRYVVGVNKANAKKFCQALITDFSKTKLYGKLVGDSSSSDPDLQQTIDDCGKQVDEIPDDDSLELWVDTSYKIISKLRYTSPEQKKSYMEFGHMYRGGDELPLFSVIHDEDEKVDLRVDVATNMKQGTSKMKLDFADTSEADMTFKMDLDIKPAAQPVTVQKPTGVTPIEDVFKQLNLGGDLSSPEFQPTLTELPSEG